MKSQNLFSWKNVKNITSLSSAEFSHSMVSVDTSENKKKTTKYSTQHKKNKKE